MSNPRGIVPPDIHALWRFIAQVEVNDDGCMIWRGTATTKGYGRIRVNGSRFLAHRYAYELAIGPIPAGLQIDHLCRVRRCVNAAHLEPVTNAENTRRGFVSRRQLAASSNP